MPGPWCLDEFVELTGAPAAEAERYRDAGLLDPFGRAHFVPRDLLALTFVRSCLDDRDDIEAVKAELLASKDPIVRRVFQRSTYSVDEAAERIGCTADARRGRRRSGRSNGHAI